jgi:hypothetical protein
MGMAQLLKALADFLASATVHIHRFSITTNPAFSGLNITYPIPHSEASHKLYKKAKYHTNAHKTEQKKRKKNNHTSKKKSRHCRVYATPKPKPKPSKKKKSGQVPIVL